MAQDVLSGLESVPWETLTHAYGPATDVPDQIRSLLDGDDAEAKDALWHLFGNIYHQGTRYYATAPAVPFLARAAIAAPSQRAAEILGLLSAIAEPAADRIYDDALSVVAYRATVQTEQDAMPEDALAECITFGCPPLVEVESYDAVMAQIPRLMDMLDTGHRDLRISLLSLLSHAPAHADDALRLAEAVISGPGDDDALRVETVDCLSRLNRSVEVQDLTPMINRLGQKAMGVFQQTHVALAGSGTDPARLETLLQAMAQAETLYETDRASERHKGWTATRVAHALCDWAETDQERVCHAIIKALPAAKLAQANTDGLVAALITCLAHPASAQGYFTQKPARDLSDLERLSLEQIADSATWTIAGLRYGNFAAQMAGYGLPDRPDALRRYLGRQKSGLFNWFRR